MRRLLFLLVLPVLLASPARATVPSTMSYQGVLMDDAGDLVPDGRYILTFRLYEGAFGGRVLWTETHDPVTVSRGGFSVILGSVASLSGLAFDVPYWLGITVGAGGELSPRVALASSPYGLSLRLPFASGFSSASPALAITNMGGGPAITADPLLTVGTPSSGGTMVVYGNGTVGAEIYPWSGYGDVFWLYDESGGPIVMMEPDGSGSGGSFLVNGGTGGGFMVDGNNGSGSPTVYIGGPGSQTYFQTDQTGDAAVLLPANSVSASEILDEPGIAQNHYNGEVYFTSGTQSATVDILSVSITIPAAGYIVLTADASFALFAKDDWAGTQITGVSGSAIDVSHYFYVGDMYAGGALAFPGYVPVSIHRTYYEAAAGTYTFYFQAWDNSLGPNNVHAFNPTLTALYTPKSYGSVVTSATAAELPQFEHVTPTSSAGNGPGQSAVSGSLVDLRELELKVARQQAALEASQRQLIEARLAEQLAKAAKSAPAKSR